MVDGIEKQKTGFRFGKHRLEVIAELDEFPFKGRVYKLVRVRTQDQLEYVSLRLYNEHGKRIKKLEDDLRKPAAELLPAMTLAEQVHLNGILVDRLSRAIDEDRRFCDQDIQHIKYEVYEPKIDALKRERDQKTAARQQMFNELEKRKMLEVTQLEWPRVRAKRIMDMLRVKKNQNLDIADDDVQPYRGRHIEAVGYLFEDEFFKVKLFIAENDKPKNKYSLVAMGRCAFPEDLFHQLRTYGLHLKWDVSFTHEVIFKDGPSIAALNQWMTPAHLQQMKDTLTKGYAQFKAEYLETLDNYKAEDFTLLMEHRCTCGYFDSKLDGYSRRDEVVTCPRCDKVMEKM